MSMFGSGKRDHYARQHTADEPHDFTESFTAASDGRVHSKESVSRERGHTLPYTQNANLVIQP